MPSNRLKLFLLILILTLTAVACSGDDEGDEAVATEAPQAVAQGPTNIPTPLPTDTPAPTDDTPAPTATPTPDPAVEAQARFESGIANFEAQAFEAALNDFTAAIELGLDDLEAYFNRGLAHESLGDLEAAIDDLTFVLERDPQYATAFGNRGNVYRQLGELEAALDDFDRAIELDPEYVSAYNNRGLVRLDNGDIDGAMADFDKAIELDPQYSPAYNNRGVVLQFGDDLEAAMVEFDQAIAFDPANLKAYNNRGIANRDLGNYEAALDDFKQAIAIEPDDEVGYFQRGRIYHYLGDLDLALADFDAVIELAPEYELGFYNRGLVHQDLGDMAAAIADFEQGLLVDSNPQTRQQAEQDLADMVALQAADSWQAFASPEDGFSVLLPAQPEKETRPAYSDPDAPSMNVFSVSYSTPDSDEENRIYLLAHFEWDILDGLTEDEVGETLEDLLADMVSRMADGEATLLSSSEAYIGDYPGLEGTVTAADSQFLVWVIAANGHIYQILAGAPASEELTAVDRQLYSTFVIDADFVAGRTTPSAAAQPGDEEASKDLQFLSFDDYVSSDYLNVVGEVQNSSDVPAEYVKISLILFDEDDKIVATDFTYTDLDVIPPGDKAPFRLITDEYEGAVRYELLVEGDPAELGPQGLEILSSSDEVDSLGFFIITGEVQNNGEQVAEFVKIVATLYNANDELLGSDFTYIEPDELAPGATEPFELIIFGWMEEKGDIDHYELQVEGL